MSKNIWIRVVEGIVLASVIMLAGLSVWAVIRAREPYTPSRNPIATGIIVIGTNQP